jgi:hypothetical protein
MGAYYLNTLCFPTTQQTVVRELKALGRVAFVLPEREGTVMIVDKECDEELDDAVADRLAKALTYRLRCNAISTLVGDDTEMWMQVHRLGEAIDFFESPLDSIVLSGVWPSTNGDSRKIATSLAKPGNAERLEQALRAKIHWQQKRHHAILRSLDLPDRFAEAGFSNLAYRLGDRIATEGVCALVEDDLNDVFMPTDADRY